MPDSTSALAEPILLQEPSLRGNPRGRTFGGATVLLISMGFALLLNGMTRAHDGDAKPWRKQAPALTMEKVASGKPRSEESALKIESHANATTGRDKLKSMRPDAKSAEAKRGHKELMLEALESHAPSIFEGLISEGYAVVDNFLPSEIIVAMRREAAALHRNGRAKRSVPENFNGNGSMDITQKLGSFAYSGLFQENLEPYLFGFTEVLKKHLPSIFRGPFPDIPLSNFKYANNLTVTMGEGTICPLHMDRLLKNDSRKLTTILYLQSNWSAQQGGCFRMFHPVDPDDSYAASVNMTEYIDIAPLGGRLLTYWSDRMPYVVRPVHGLSEESHRWALTTWFAQDNEWLRVRQAEEEFLTLLFEMEARYRQLNSAQLHESACAAFKQKFGCTLEEKQEQIKRTYGLH